MLATLLEPAIFNLIRQKGSLRAAQSTMRSKLFPGGPNRAKVDVVDSGSLLRPKDPNVRATQSSNRAYGARALVSLLAVLALVLYFASPAGRMLSWPSTGASLVSSGLFLAHALTEGKFLLARYAVQNFAMAAAVVCADYLLGAGLLRLVHRSARMYNAPLRAAVALSIGAGLGGMTVFFLAELHWMGGLSVWAGTIIAAGLGALILTKRRAWRR